MERDKVIDAVDGEREYQTDMAARGDNHVVPRISLGDTITAMQYNLDAARSEWYTSRKPHENAMHFVRKIAALAIQAGEQYGMPRREGY
jgi:hypothetical protein